ncbi:MAG: hypothetical protein M5U26_10540 [Planctomycetota bacterium]|nr:hypothetical protein [Planctomycetota bacterium]
MESLADALAFFRSGSAELVLTDYESFGALREERPGLPAILLCDAADSRQTIDAMKRGALAAPARGSALENATMAPAAEGHMPPGYRGRDDAPHAAGGFRQRKESGQGRERSVGGRGRTRTGE